MASTAQDVLEQVLEKGGFVQKGRWSSGLINAEIAKTNATTDLRYGHPLDTSKENGPIVDLVYEVPNDAHGSIPGNTAIYFKVLEEPSAESITTLRTLVWNQGRTPTLWIVTPQNVLIYDSYARPQKDDNEKNHLLAELRAIGGQIKLLNEFHKKSFDTGDFWQSKYGKEIKQKQRVDEAMLDDLSKTEGILTSSLKEHGLSSPTAVAHALLGRAIFASYLEDRHILEPSFFQDRYGCDSFKDALSDKEATYAFFKWLRETFNGNLFPFHDEETQVQESDLKIISLFLSGTNMGSYPLLQPRLWPYKFDFIPIELISSIYEMFAHVNDSQTAANRSTHYTRLRLVELVLSLAMHGMTSKARILDPACGSGIFLVEAFKRLVWMREKEHGKGYTIQRDELHEMLCSQIFGIDIDSDAVDVTAFSLYLTLLELDPDPQPPTALKFPLLLSSDTQSDKLPNLYVQDFCNTEHIFNRNEPFVSKGFDLIVGNPPWTALAACRPS